MSKTIRAMTDEELMDALCESWRFKREGETLGFNTPDDDKRYAEAYDELRSRLAAPTDTTKHLHDDECGCVEPSCDGCGTTFERWGELTVATPYGLFCSEECAITKRDSASPLSGPHDETSER